MAFKGPIPDGYVIVRKVNILSMNGMNNLEMKSKSYHGRRTGPKSRSKAVELLDDSGNVIDSWPSARKAAKDLYLSYQAVTDI